jgi:hypothetical protein
VILADVSGVDVRRKEVIADGRRVNFDNLVIATGAQHAYFGHEESRKYAPGLKRIDDATNVKRRILLAFEKAETKTDEEERRRLPPASRALTASRCPALRLSPRRRAPISRRASSPNWTAKGRRRSATGI